MPDIGWVDADNPVLNQLDAAASRYGVDRNLVHTVAQMESAYNPQAVSPVGAQGVMQLMPATARGLGVTDSMDPAQNIDGGVRYLRNLSQKYGGDNRLVLAAYNAGPGAVDRAGGVPNFKETKNYVDNGISILGSAPKSTGGTPDIGWEDATPAPETLTLQATVKTPQNVQMLPPLSEPPGPPQPEEKSVEGFLNNLTTSAYNNLLSPIVHPGQTLAGISNLLEGMGEMTGNKPVPGMHGRQAIEGLTDLYTQRYGSWQGFKDAWYKDPVGMLGDLAIAADGLGLGKAAAQDFIRASGLTDAATAARDTLAGAVPNMGKVGAATTAGVKAVPGAAVAGFKKAFDPALILSGPHSMLIGGKLEFAKQVAKAARDAWKGAGEAPEVAEAAAEAAPAAAIKLTPEEQAFAEQFRPPPAAPATPSDLAGQAAQASMSPRVMLRSEAEQAFPEFYGQPASAPATPPITPAAEPLKAGDAVQWTSQGVDQFQEPRAIRGFSPDGKWAFVEGTDTGIPVEQLTRAETPSAPPATPPLTPQELTNLETGRPPSRQTEAAQQTAAETLATAQAAAPPAAQAAPEVPPAAPAVPPAAEAPTGPPVDPVTWTREQLAAGNPVSPATLQRQFGMKYSAARKLLKDLAPPTTAAEGQAAFEAAKASGQPAVTPTPEEAPATPEPPSELEQQLAQSIREAQARKTTSAPTVQPGQTTAEALAAAAPPGPKSLAEMMTGIPERPELEPLDFAAVTRTRNVERLYDTMKEAGITPAMVDAEGDAGWAAVAKKAKIGPKGKAYVPSETTKAQLRQRFSEAK